MIHRLIIKGLGWTIKRSYLSIDQMYSDIELTEKLLLYLDIKYEISETVDSFDSITNTIFIHTIFIT